MKVDKSLLPMKGHYFLFNAGSGLVIPYMPVLAKELGFSSVIVGVIYTCLPILALIIKPTMGAIADKFHLQKGMFLIFIFITMASLVVIPWIPALPTQSPGELHCSLESDVRICSESLESSDCFPDIVKQLGNTSLQCGMVCEANSSFLESVCETWHQPKYCAALKTPNHPLLTMVKQNLSINTPDTPKKKFATKEPQTLHFTANLLPQHTSQIKECIFIRVGKVKFGLNDPSVVPYCDTFKAATCKINCDNAVIASLTSAHISDGEAVGLYQFWMFCLALVIGWVSIAIVTSISDAICFELLGEFPSKYGNQRLWGSLGWGLFSFLGGVVIDQFSQGQSAKNHAPNFILMIIILAINLVVAWKLKYKQVKTSASILQDVGRLLSEGRVLVFFLWCISVGMCTAMVWNFLFWFLEDLAADCDTKSRIKTLEGLAMTIQCLGGELPFFFLSGWVLKKIGHVHSMSLILFGFGLRFILYSILSNPWWVLPIELLNGLTFGMAYACMTSYASIVAPPGTETTIQGLVGAVFEGLGVSAGSFLGGLLMNKMKGEAVFRIFGIAAFIGCIVHAVLQYFLAKRTTTILSIHEKDFKDTKYASPNDAIHMLGGSLQDFNPPQ